jgi:hypothetical protein
MQLADDELGVNCERKVEKIIFVSVERLFIRVKHYFFAISFVFRPHLSSASCRCKTVISQKRRFESKEVASGKPKN